VGYAWAPKCEFTNYDDPPYVSENADIASGLSWHAVQWAFTTYTGANWHPVTWLSHALDCQLFGVDAAQHHVMNVAYHAANTLLLFWLLVRMTGERAASFLVAALFAIHPLHVESVAWISERKDVLSTLFFFLTLHAYHSYATRGGMRRYVLVMIIMALGLMSKPMLVTLPPLMLLLDFWPLARWPMVSKGGVIRSRLCLILEKVPLAVLSIIACVVTLKAQQAMGATHMIGDELTFGTRMGNAGVAYVEYLRMMIWPSSLAAFYPYVFDRSIVAALLAWSFVAFISVGSILVFHKRPYLTVGWFWYLGTLVPVIGFVQVGGQSMADRYTYIPLVGLFWAIVWSIKNLAERYKESRPLLAAACAIALFCLIVATSQQLVCWTNSETLFRRAAAVTQNNCVAYDNLGDTFSKQHRYREAEAEFRKVLAIDDRHFRYVRAELAKALQDQGRTSEAIDVLREAVRRDDKDAESRNNLALLLAPAPQWKVQEAIDLLHQATRIAPERAEGWRNLAWILATCPARRFRNGPEAVKAASKAVEIGQEKSVADLSLLADAYLEAGDYREEAATLEKALLIAPHDLKLHSRAASAYQQLGRPEEAMKHLLAADEKAN
jgi:tetratricopeptide (TPR) repeat protein